MKLKRDIEKAYSIMYRQKYKAKKNEDKQMEYIYQGFLCALEWVQGSKELGIDDLPDTPYNIDKPESSVS